MLSFGEVRAAENLLMVNENEISEAIKKEFVEQGRFEAVDLEFLVGRLSFKSKMLDRLKSWLRD